MMAAFDILGGTASLLIGLAAYALVTYAHHAALGISIASRNHTRGFRRHKREGIPLFTRLFFLDFRDSLNTFQYAAYIAHLILGLLVVVLLTIIGFWKDAPDFLRYALAAAFMLDALLIQVPVRGYLKSNRRKKHK